MKIIYIDRKKWLRGEGYKASRLIRKSDDKQCCLGFYLNQCGIPKDKLINQESPEEVLNCETSKSWLISKENGDNSLDCQDLMSINDSEHSDEKIRENDIKRIFKKHKVKVIFK